VALRLDRLVVCVESNATTVADFSIFCTMYPDPTGATLNCTVNPKHPRSSSSALKVFFTFLTAMVKVWMSAVRVAVSAARCTTGAACPPARRCATAGCGGISRRGATAGWGGAERGASAG